MRYVLTIALTFSTFVVHGQEKDSTQILTFDMFYAYVLESHPIVKQAQLLSENAVQQLRLARGSFDPKLEGNWNYKDFKETDYYNKADIGLKIPVWFPVDPKVGIQQNSGKYLNPENFIADETNNRQIYMGVSLPIGQGLFIDERRAMVKQARLFQDMAEAEQIKAINKVLLTAAKDYWEWYFAYKNYQLIEQSIGIAQDIFDRTLVAYDYGETAAIDTIQAQIALQSRRIEFQQANVQRIQAGLELSNHLWTADGMPLELSKQMVPEEAGAGRFDQGMLAQLIDMALKNHPELVKLGLKNESLIIDRKLAKENIKPQLDLDYTLLDQPIAPEGGSSEMSFTDNYKLGLSFAFPIFIRKERGKLKQIDIKVEQNLLEQTFRERQIINDIGARYNEVLTMGSILEQQQQMVNNYNLILTAERLNLQNGESDLFKINIQFDKLIKSQTKLFKLQSEYQKSVAGLYWAAGIANLGYPN